MDLEMAEEKIFAEIAREDRSVRQGYLRAFEPEARAFAKVMAGVMTDWAKAYSAPQIDEEKKKVPALAYVAASLHINSMKLFLSGHQIAAGNLMRQVTEAIALALLCTNKGSDALATFEANRYASSKAIIHLKKHAAKMGLKKPSLVALEEAQAFYSQFSHPS